MSQSSSEIACILNRLAAAEARIAALEARQSAAVVNYPIGGNSPPQLGKDATCSYCGGAFWVCRGSHVIS